jgi:hypothetical protein
MDARGYRRSGPPYGRASTTTAASPKANPDVTSSFRVTGQPCCDDRLSSGGVFVVVRVCAWDPVLAPDRAGVLGGRGVQGDHRRTHLSRLPRHEPPRQRERPNTAGSASLTPRVERAATTTQPQAQTEW